MNFRWDVFLCYSKHDLESARDLYGRLGGSGFKVWFDDEEVLPGQRWEARIEEGIRESQIFLICLSSRWVDDKSHAHKELRLAVEHARQLPEDRVFIVPARFDDCQVPRSVRNLKWVNLFEDHGDERLQASLRANLRSATPVEPAASARSVSELFEALRSLAEGRRQPPAGPMSEARELAPSELARIANRLAGVAASAEVQPAIVAAQLDLPAASLDLSGAATSVWFSIVQKLHAGASATAGYRSAAVVQLIEVLESHVPGHQELSDLASELGGGQTV